MSSYLALLLQVLTSIVSCVFDERSSTVNLLSTLTVAVEGLQDGDCLCRALRTANFPVNSAIALDATTIDVVSPPQVGAIWHTLSEESPS
jgi:hypothetical protein